MSLFAIALPALTFILCLFIHAALWRLRFPPNRAVCLLAIFVLFPAAAAGAWALLASKGLFWLPSLEKGEWLAAALLQLAFASAYILSYPAFEALSPSLVIVLLAGGSGGVAMKDLPRFFDDGTLFEPRVRDLLASRLATDRDGVLSITPKGRLLARTFALMRFFLGLPKGGG
jgi:hypothetical protein